MLDVNPLPNSIKVCELKAQSNSTLIVCKLIILIALFLLIFLMKDFYRLRITTNSSSYVNFKKISTVQATILWNIVFSYFFA